MKKKIIITLLSALTISTLLTACNSKENNVNAQENAVTESETMTQEESSTETETTTQEESSTEIETTTQEESSTETETTTQEESSTEIESNLESDTESNTEIDSSKTDSAESTKFTTTPLDTMMYATQQCNIRKGPSTDNDIIGALSQAEGIHITGRVDDLNWYEVSLADGSTGYVSGKLLTETKPTVQVEASNPTPQQGVNSQNTSEGLLTPDQVINPDTGEPYKPGDVDKNGMTYVGSTFDENGNQVAPNGSVFHRGGK